ncbi:helix-turn-helix transcriptional regulator [uncultured Shewanella sp.]|uniref:helix-turn-helix domain-containing protein n=1 Tax=uncultured Shewanella sp. TaxID=173975 RepID=UPI00262C3DD3|nr:helix-turn-helix transcriptional regulator [uncultured Shewanella sp.]
MSDIFPESVVQTYQVTRLGRKLRQYRVDNEMILKDMADLLGVTCVYLSSIELGKLPVSAEMGEKITMLFFNPTKAKPL